jgi:hypothetical protein
MRDRRAVRAAREGGRVTGSPAPAEIFLSVGDGEGSGDTRICIGDEELIQFLWEQCGPDHTGSEEKSRAYWREYLANEDNWIPVDGYRRWRCSFDVGETGHILIQRMEPDSSGGWPMCPADCDRMASATKVLEDSNAALTAAKRAEEAALNIATERTEEHRRFQQQRDELATALEACANRFERCCIQSGSDKDFAAAAVSDYRALIMAAKGRS